MMTYSAIFYSISCIIPFLTYTIKVNYYQKLHDRHGFPYLLLFTYTYAPSHPSSPPSFPSLLSPLLHLALCGPLSRSLSPVPCPFIIAPSLPLVSRLAGSRWRGREGGRDVGKDGWREGWKTGGGDVLSSVPMFIPSQCRPTSCSLLCTVKLFTRMFFLIIFPHFHYLNIM